MIITEKDRVLSLLEPTYILHSADQRDNLNNYLKELQYMIQGNFEPIDELINRWTMDDYYGVDYAIDALEKEIQSEFNVDSERAHALYLKYEDYIRESIYDRDNSNLFQDLLRNTSDPAIFYDLDVYVGGYGEDINSRMRTVKQALKIKLKDKTWDKELNEMILNAGYGGQLVIYFNISLDDLIGKQAKTIIFEDPVIAITDVAQGSGGNCDLPKHRVTFPFNRKNLYICRTIKYGYTHDVCGMSDDWCSNTTVKFLGRSSREIPTTSPTPIAQHLELEATYNKTFKNGGCTQGDMDMKRHRNTYYKNEFPCGTHCKDCGNFWID